MTFKASVSTPIDCKGESQLTDATQYLIDARKNVMGIRLEKSDQWFDIGSPSAYWKALFQSRSLS